MQIKKISFLFFNIFLAVSVFAQSTTTSTSTESTSKYSNANILTKANELCARYTNYNSIYDTPSVGGGSSVPVDLSQLRDVLLNISRNTQLSANEFRQFNLLKFCSEYQNMAVASIAIAAESQKTLKNLAETCSADETCLTSRVFNSDKQKEIERAMKSPVYGREISQLILNNVSRTNNQEELYDLQLLQRCNTAKAQGRNPIECITAPTTEEVILTRYYAAKNRIETNQNQLQAEFGAGGGVVGNRTCTKTASGKDPSEVRFYDEDCISYKSQPQTVNQESLRQIVALPYNQANSPGSVLGTDGVTNNINTRVREGNLIDPNMGANFGSNTGTNGGTSGGTGTSDLKSVEENYKKILQNIGVITDLYGATTAFYASTTSACIKLPVKNRTETIAAVNAAKKTYTDYRDGLNASWAKALKTPNESHIDLITKINLDLKDKLNQTLINQVYDKVKELFAACTNAK